MDVDVGDLLAALTAVVDAYGARRSPHSLLNAADESVEGLKEGAGVIAG